MAVSPRRFALTTPLRADRGDIAIVHGVERLVGVVLRVAVAEVRGHQQVVLALDGQDRHGGNNSRRVSFASAAALPSSIWSTVANPLEDRLVVLGIRFEALAASVRCGHGGLQQQQALFRVARLMRGMRSPFISAVSTW